MTCNFYVKEKYSGLYPIERGADELLIGKRAAAGWFCWDCRVPLRTIGMFPTTAMLHGDVKHIRREWGDIEEIKYHDKCPRCSLGKDEETWESAVGRELGFKKGDMIGKTGVKSTSSFTFALKFQELYPMLHLLDKVEDLKPIKDEYGKEYSVEDFFMMLEECAIQFFDISTNWC